MADSREHPGILVRRRQAMPVGAQIRGLRIVAERNPIDIRNRFLYLDELVR
jgi:hypothetical protein